MKIKTGDTVAVITGKDKGAKGKVLAVIPKKNRVIVEGVNIQAKHQKQTRNLPAEIRHVEGPIDASNVVLVESSRGSAKAKTEKKETKKESKKDNK
jgi:large subunit ribosomal protein L24